MNQCPACGKKYEGSLTYCPFDGQVLAVKKDQDGMLGSVLDGKFRLTEKVGEGGMGKVYRAKHVHLDYTVAIKILHPHLSFNKVALERFRREAQAAIYIRHPNAVAVTDFGVANDTGMAYLVMEYLNGVDLRERIARQKQLDYSEILLVTRQTCSALQAAHSKGVVHRDLKPENIWIIKSEDGAPQVKVLDFGIAKIKMAAELNRLTEQGTIIGTPFYMSPEQCRGEELDGRSDIYSLGVIMYEMLTGELPFHASTYVGLALKHISEHPSPPSKLRPDIPPPVEDVVMRALNKSLEERQQSPVEMASELEEALAAAGVSPGVRRINTPQPVFEKSAVHHTTPDLTQKLESDMTGRSAAEFSPGDFNSGVSDPLYGVRFETKPGPERDPNNHGFSGSATGQKEASGTGSFWGLRTIGLNDLFAERKRGIFIALAIVIGVAAIIIIRESSPGKKVTGSRAEAATPVPPPGMTYVRAGEFVMGSNDPNTGYASRPAHPVALKPFFLDINEVTNEEYQEFVDATGRRAPLHWENNKYPSATAKFPVYGVSWQDAIAYAEWRGKRLPTEAEWEYAARGESGQIFPWGKEWSDRKANLKERGLNGVMTVGSFPEYKSWCGANDIVGNVAEWVWDHYQPYPNGLGKPDYQLKIYRGGSYQDSKEQPLTIIRKYNKAEHKQADIGFRCARDL